MSLPSIQPAVVGKKIVSILIEFEDDILKIVLFWIVINVIISQFCIGGSTDLSEIRTSKNTWIEDGTSDLVDKISLRINRFTGLQTTKIYDDFKEGKKDEYESLQVVG